MVLMLDIARLTSSLAEAFPEHQAQKLVAVISEALQSVFESEVVRRLDELIEASLRHDAQIAENTRAIERLIRVTEQQSEQIAENTRAIAELRAVTEKHSEQIAENTRAIAENTRAIAELRAVTEKHSEQIAENTRAIAENTRAIAELRAVTEKHSEQIAENTRAIAENTRAIAELRAVTEKHSEQIAENTRAIAELRASVERLARTAERHERRLENLERQMGGLSATVGYTLENTAYKALPVLLARDYGIQVQGKLTRDYVVAPDGSAYEVNILGTGVQNGRTVTIVGESKVQLSVQEVDRFLRRKLKPLQSLVENPFPVLVAHMVSSPKVLPHARAKGVAVYLSYEFD
jgi:myosin heavy subunit